MSALGFCFTTVNPQIDETPIEGERARDYVVRLAVEKALKGRSLIADNTLDAVVMGADTCVAVGDLKLGKPEDPTEAMQMLNLLSGRVHEVHSAVAVTHNDNTCSRVETTQVEFSRLDTHQLEEYLQSGEYENRAGAYAIQGSAAGFVRRMNGSRSCVIGLPITSTLKLLQEVGMAVPDLDRASLALEREFPATAFQEGQISL